MDNVLDAPFSEPSPSTPGGTTRIGRSEPRASSSPTLPTRKRRNADRPWVPVTISSASISRARLRTDVSTSPSHTRKVTGTAGGRKPVALRGQPGLDVGPHLRFEDDCVGRQSQDVDGARLHHVNQLDPASGAAGDIDGDLRRRLAAWREIRGAYDLHGCLALKCNRRSRRKYRPHRRRPRISCAPTVWRAGGAGFASPPVALARYRGPSGQPDRAASQGPKLRPQRDPHRFGDGPGHRSCRRARSKRPAARLSESHLPRQASASVDMVLKLGTEAPIRGPPRCAWKTRSTRRDTQREMVRPHRPRGRSDAPERRRGCDEDGS